MPYSQVRAACEATAAQVSTFSTKARKRSRGKGRGTLRPLFVAGSLYLGILADLAKTLWGVGRDRGAWWASVPASRGFKGRCVRRQALGAGDARGPARNVITGFRDGER